MIIAAVNYIGQYQLNVSLIEESNITFWYWAGLCLYLSDTKKEKKSLLQPYFAMQSLNIKFQMHLNVQLFENKSYHHKSLWNLENMLKNVLAIIFVNLVGEILFPIK